VAGAAAPRSAASSFAKENVFRLDEPLEGVADRQRYNWRWCGRSRLRLSILAFRGILPGEDGDELAALVEEMFPIQK
jgi:hypothetical protein